MANSYSDLGTFRRDVWIISEDELPPAIVREAADIAYEVINAALVDVYTVPFSVTYPGIIVKISNLLVRHFASELAVRAEMPIQREATNTKKEALELLDELRNGTKSIVGIERLSTLGPWSNTEGQVQVFGLDHYINYGPDKDRIEDLADLREDSL